jgi:protein TonB
MFDNSLLPNRRTKTPLGIAVGILGELTAIGTAILIPLIYTEHLPALTWNTPLAVPARGPEPPPAEVIQVARERGAQVVRYQPSSVLHAPVRVPDKVAMLIDEPAPSSWIPGSTGPVTQGIHGLPLTADGPLPPPPAKIAEAPAVKEAPKEISRVRVGGIVQAAKLINRVLPVYPALARQARVQGTVSVIAVIGTDGTVRELRVVSGHPLLVQAALQAVRQWVYKPTMLNGYPVEVESPIDVHFTLGQ